MKTLFLVRHSKAEENAPSDFERKLTAEGIKLAHKIASKLSIIPGKESIFVSSPALRAIETAKEFSRIFEIHPERIIKNEFLYKYSPTNRFFMFIDSIDNNSEIWIFGHNPMLSELVSYLTGDAIESMPKCAVAAFQTSALNWFEASPLNTRLLFFENPKNQK